MLIRKSMMLFACAALSVAACENKSDTSKQEPNPGATTTPPDQPVTITNAPVTPPAAAPPANPIAKASNATEVTQFPEQMKLSPTQATIMSTAATVRPAPQSSDKVQVVKQGLAVTEVAKDKDYVLVLFNDPNDTSKEKAGWIHKDSLENYAFEQNLKNDKAANNPSPITGQAAKVAPAASKLTCNKGEARLETDHAFCALTCKDDGDCKKLNGVCDGNGKMVDISGKLQAARYCVTDNTPGATTGSSNGAGNSTSSPSMQNNPSAQGNPSNPSSPSTPSKTAPTTR
jgi:hypothetical protein